MAAKKSKNIDKDKVEDKQSPRSQAASNRALSQYVNKVVADVRKKYPDNKDMQFALAAGVIAEGAENNAQRKRLTNRAANKIGIEKYLASDKTKYGESVPRKIKNKKDKVD